MESFFIRYKNALVLITVLLVQTIGLAIQVRRPAEGGAPDGPRVTLLRSWVIGAVTPFERFFHGIGHSVRYGWTNYIDLRSTRRQNEALHDEVARLRLEQAQLAEDAMQGHRLQGLLKFQQNYIASTVAAQVIGSSGTDQSRVLYIDKGSADGLKIDQAVITPDGIVGKLREVLPHTSQVLVINDQTSGAGVVLATTRIRTVLRGSAAGNIVITNLTPDERIKPGEQVLTSGGDQVYPRGLPVGTIESIAPDPEHQPYTMIHIKPAANLFQLEEVLVITGTQPVMTAKAQSDLTQGAQTAQKQAEEKAAKAAADEAAAAAQSAAQIVADRLPSIHEAETEADPTAPAGTQAKPTPANPAGVVPKPLPTQHSDRYSTGATPPAASLTPGGTHPAGQINTPTPVPSSEPKSRPDGPQPPPKNPANSSTNPKNQPSPKNPSTSPNSPSASPNN